MIPILFADNATTTTSDDVFTRVGDFFDSNTWLVIRNLAILFLIVFWLATVYWVYKDARRRVEDPWLVATAVVLGIVPFIGPLVYLFFRPPEYLEDRRERELEIRAMEEQIGQRVSHCPVCRAAVEPDFLVCPVCTTKLKQACTGCKAPLEPLWQVCPYCEAPVVRRSSVFEDPVPLSPPTLEEPLRLPRRGSAAVGEDQPSA
jgi:RNA polymerase subunit RPABC4/transcription elongation factor Spt4